jgi:hypothetical protein
LVLLVSQTTAIAATHTSSNVKRNCMEGLGATRVSRHSQY